ncbi:GIY-YIG nuclease family protein [Viridibacillus arvi]|uniref:GIY-YIG nuclease family protein n=1 Tax=Viridibacillus arvi TaxID=263475 RepID=UPI0034CEDB3C
MNYTKLGGTQFTVPDLIHSDYTSRFPYEKMTDELEAVYILRGENEEVLYVGYSTQLKKRLTTHLYGSFKDEIKTIEYIPNERMQGNVFIMELEKILYYLLKPKYSKKKIYPHTLHTMSRISKQG